MYTKEEFKIKLKQNLNNLEISEIINKLIDFMFDDCDDYFSSGFELEVDQQHEIWKMYSEDPNFYNCLFTFAKADGSGSSYSFWINNNQTNLDEVPIVISGSEGGLHVVAENIKELLKILSYDAEASVDHDGVAYYKEDEEDIKKFFENLAYKAELMSQHNGVAYDKDDYAYSDGMMRSKCNPIYLQWLKDQFNYTTFEDLNETVINEIVIKAQDKYQKQFKEWIEKFYKE